jgi:hypothetical protein
MDNAVYKTQDEDKEKKKTKTKQKAKKMSNTDPHRKKTGCVNSVKYNIIKVILNLSHQD